MAALPQTSSSSFTIRTICIPLLILSLQTLILPTLAIECVPDWPKELNNYGRNHSDPCTAIHELWAFSEPINAYTAEHLFDIADMLVPGPITNLEVSSLTCSDVFYNGVSACSACANGRDASHWQDHDTWFRSCQTIDPNPFSGLLDENKPSLWMTHSYDDRFTVEEALKVQGGLEQPVSTGSGGPPLPSTTSNSEASPISGTKATGNSRSLPLGALIGIIVGSVVVAVILGVLVFLWVRKRKQEHIAPSAEFMRYAQGNRPTVLAPLQPQDEERGGGADERVLPVRGSEEVQEVEALPPFTPGLFKDPIFEKGVALNLGLSPSGTEFDGPAPGSSPNTYSPLTPSTAFSHVAPERQRLISKRHGSN